ncbi:MAG: DNA topoisomerase I [Methanomassiliicoccaceae archaeon]|nr:DNA topoisomerase I [Methanomassiliicoccaceae archaeon]
MRKLVITEKANAARRISTILSDGKARSGAGSIMFNAGSDEYHVVSLSGHILELDYPKEFNDWNGSSPVDLVYAPQVKTVRAKSTLDTISRISKDSDEIIIATDYDREGELIGLETVRAAGVELSKVKRARFSALTKGEIENAFSSLTEPDVRLSDAAEARQIIDLTWGAVLTRSVSLSSGQVGKNFLSVGRVQSPTLKLLVDRNEEIESFKPTPFWKINGKFGMLAFKGEHINDPFWEKEKADEILNKCRTMKKGVISSYEVSMKEEFRPPPFDTTGMQVEANKIGITPAATMKLAEDLYTSGYISYPRTENTEYPKSLSLRSVLEKLKDSDFSDEVKEILSQESISPSRGKRRTTDHPPIYPTSAATQDKMKGDKWKLYELIVRRFLATVATNAFSEITKCTIDVNNEEFVADGNVLKKAGWKKYYSKYLSFTDTIIPELKKGDEIEIRAITQESSQTKPPFRYNQGSLIQEMDRLNLGTKSTRHDIIGKLFSRNYVQGNYLIPTPVGVAMTRSLEKHGGGITEPDMTAKLEENMKKISTGERKLSTVVGESQKMLHSVSEKLNSESNEVGNEIRSALKEQQHIGICPSCGNTISIKRSKNGNFIGCDGYPDCARAYPLPRGAMIQTTEEKCDVCKLPLMKVIRRGSPPQTVCIDPKCSSNTSKNEIGECPSCGKQMRVMYSKTGKRFAGCSGWPECNRTYPLRPTGTISPTGEKCTQCNSPVVTTGSRTECINIECPSKGAIVKKSDTAVKKSGTVKSYAVRNTSKKVGVVKKTVGVVKKTVGVVKKT